MNLYGNFILVLNIATRSKEQGAPYKARFFKARKARTEAQEGMWIEYRT